LASYRGTSVPPGPGGSLQTHATRKCCVLYLCSPWHTLATNTPTPTNLAPPLVCDREWPVEALSSVASSFFADVDLGVPATTDESDPAVPAAAGPGAHVGGLAGVVQCCVAIHKSVEARSKRYYEELRRWV
jgi:hypothetical protein